MSVKNSRMTKGQSQRRKKAVDRCGDAVPSADLFSHTTSPRLSPMSACPPRDMPRSRATMTTMSMSSVPKPRSHAARSVSQSPAPPLSDRLALSDRMRLFDTCVPWWQAQRDAVVEGSAEATTIRADTESLAQLLSAHPMPYTHQLACFLAFPANHATAWERMTVEEGHVDKDDADARTTTLDVSGKPMAGETLATPRTGAGRDRRVFLGQLHRRHTVGLLRWLFHRVLLIPRASVRHIDAHQDARTGRGKGCAWVTLAPDADPALEDHLIALHHHLLFDIFKNVDGVWLVPQGEAAVLQRELECRSVSEKAPLEPSRRLPRGALVVERPRSRLVETATVATVPTPHLARRPWKADASPCSELSLSPPRGRMSPVAGQYPASRLSLDMASPPSLTVFCPAEYGAASTGYGTPRQNGAAAAATSCVPAVVTGTPNRPASGSGRPPYSAGTGLSTPEPAVHTRHPHWRPSEELMASRNFCESYMMRSNESASSPVPWWAAENAKTQGVVPLLSETSATAPLLSPALRVLGKSGTGYRNDPYATNLIDSEESWSSRPPSRLNSQPSQDTLSASVALITTPRPSLDDVEAFRLRSPTVEAEMPRVAEAPRCTPIREDHPLFPVCATHSDRRGGGAAVVGAVVSTGCLTSTPVPNRIRHSPHAASPFAPRSEARGRHAVKGFCHNPYAE